MLAHNVIQTCYCVVQTFDYYLIVLNISRMFITIIPVIYPIIQSRRMGGASHTTFFSRGKSLTSREFSELLYERLSAVEKDRANLQQRAQNFARESGKKFEDIMVSNAIISNEFR